MRHIRHRILFFLLAATLAAVSAFGEGAPPAPVITDVHATDTNGTPPQTSITAGVHTVTVTVTGTNFSLTPNPAAEIQVMSLMVWVPSVGACPVESCVFQVTPVTATQFTVDLPDALVANADPGAAVVVRNAGPIDSAPFPVPVNPKVTNAGLPTAYRGLPYAAYITSGGTFPYTVNAPIVNVPGLTAEGSPEGGGRIFGTIPPDISLGNHSGTALVRDAWSQTAPSTAYSVPVDGLPYATAGVPYSVAIPFAGAGPYIVTTTSGNLPPGITIGMSGGALNVTGTPTAAGSYVSTLRIDRPNGQLVTTGTLAITVNAPVRIVTMVVPPLQAAGTAYSALLQAQSGAAPYRWTVVSGSLPAGLSLNSQTGVISGSAPANGSTFTVQVTDNFGNTDARVYYLYPQLRFITTTLPSGTEKLDYVQKIEVAGGSGNYRYNVDPASLPPGLALNAFGVLIGGPTKAGTYTFTVSFWDTVDLAQSAVTQDFTVVINPAVLTVMTASPLPDVRMGPVAVTFVAAGGVAPYTWDVTSGALPPGTALSTAGALAGTATAQGVFNFTLTVTDSRKSTASKAFIMTVTPALLKITTGTQLPKGYGQTPYSTTVTATGGTLPYTWTAAGLPPALSIDPATGVISGTPGPAGSFGVILSVRSADGQTDTIVSTMLVTVAPLTITANLANATAGAPYSATLTASGGVPPYSWTFVGAPLGNFSLSSDGKLTGSYPDSAALSFAVQVTDAQGNTARAMVGLWVAPAKLVITNASLADGTAGVAYSQTLAAVGGVPPFAWTGTLPAGLNVDSATGIISGACLLGGVQPFQIRVTDASGTYADASYSARFSMLPMPAVNWASVTAVPLSQPPVGFSLASSYPLGIIGTVTLSFKPDTGADDPSVQFSTGGRTAPFSIAANATAAALNGLKFQAGTTSGVITLTLSGIQSGLVDITPATAPATQIRVAAGVPVITKATATAGNGTLTVQITGYSATREITEGVFKFTAASGTVLGANQSNIQLGSLFSAWYKDAASAPYGSQFLFTQAFNVQGDAHSITSIAVTLANSQGVSQVTTIPVQ
jgi:hypothetical protein